MSSPLSSPSLPSDDAGFELPPPEGKEGEDDGDDGGDDGGGRDESAVTRYVYLDRIKNAQTAEDAL